MGMLRLFPLYTWEITSPSFSLHLLSDQGTAMIAVLGEFSSLLLLGSDQPGVLAFGTAPWTCPVTQDVWLSFEISPLLLLGILGVRPGIVRTTPLIVHV
jgi:hypothetical protein